ncbi:hypothetical protein GCM10009827_116550 [Dactylosporangium maewongense]|uniref:Secreted protein n=1 Tax=Dactylosporangium maewongense TaxID=634393 RepID=A0ABN2DDC3_9ACTN
MPTPSPESARPDQPDPTPTPYNLTRRGFVTAGAAAAAGVLMTVSFGHNAAVAAPDTDALTTDALTVEPDDLAPITIYSTSFEDATDPTWISNSTAYDSSASHTGANSLRYSRTDPASYTVPSVAVAAAPAQQITASVFIKASELTGAGGATLAIEAYSAAGGWLGGRYTKGIRPTEWTRLELDTFDVPANAARISTLLYLERGTTGTVSFDDLTVLRLPPRLLQPVLARPPYRGTLLPVPGEDQRIQVQVQLQPLDGATAQHVVQIDMFDAAGGLVDSRVYPGAPMLEHSYDAARLPHGRYQLRVRALAAGTSNVEQERQFTITKLRRRDVPKSYVDGHGRLIRNGKPFFPIGIYDGTRGSSRAKIIQNLNDIRGSFNAVMDYNPPSRDTLDRAHERGISYIYSIKDFFYNSIQPEKPDAIRTEADEVPYIEQTVRQFRDHPALLAWYVNDELPVDKFGRQLVAHQNAVVANDPHHPTYAVDYIVRPAYLQLRTADLIGMDDYPIRGEAGDTIGSVGRLVGQEVQLYPNRGQWSVIQLHNLGNYGQRGLRPPTLAEVRNMSWQAIAAGATGLLYYSRFDLERDASGVPYRTLLDNAKSVVNEIGRLSDVILSTDRLADVTTTGGPGLMWTTRVHRGTGFLVAVNAANTNLGEVTFTVPGLRKARQSGEGRWQTANGALTVALPPLAVLIYELKR